MPRHSVLVVDDDESTRSYLSQYLSSRGYTVNSLSTGEGVVSRLRSSDRPAAVILDLLMPGTGGLDVLAQMQRMQPRVPAIVLSAVGQIRTVVEAMRLGAVDYLIKPFEERDLESALEDALNHRIPAFDAEPARQERAGPTESDFISSDRKMRQVRSVAEQVADTDVPILILGESGVGKEVLARFIHVLSDRRNEPFVKVNCAALPVDLLESELFGYERGAFTGALRDKPGKFELAGKGTILLDEIGEMNPGLQAKLLHVLQDGECARVGGIRSIPVAARVLASTNRRLEEAIRDGEFREDLYYRLNVIKIEVPPLRERRGDILPLCRRFLEKYRSKYHRGALELPPAMLETLQQYHWPGNIRQLENVIKRYVLLPDLDQVLAELRFPPAPPEPVKPRTSLKDVSASAAEEAEKQLIMRTLNEVNWNRRQAARQLNICYKSLLNKLRRWQPREKPGAAPADRAL